MAACLGLFVLLWVQHAGSLSAPNKPIFLEQPTVLIVVFDGFSADYVGKLEKVRENSNLTQFYRQGVYAPKGMKSQMITATFPNHYSLVTGMYTENHGMITNIMVDPRTEFINQTFHMYTTDPKWWEDGHAEPLWLTNQKYNNKKSGVLFWPGHNVKIRGSYPTYRIENSTKYNIMPYAWDPLNRGYMPWNDRIDQLIQWLGGKEPPNFLALYFEEPDEVGHKYGPDSEEVLEEILRVDDTIGYMRKRFQEVNLWDQVNVILTADHGMVQLRNDCALVLDHYINETKYQLLAGATLLLKPKEGYEEIIFQNISRAVGKGLIAVYRKADLPEKYHFKNHVRVPEIIGIVEEGCRIMISNQTNLNETDDKVNISQGGHGFSPDFHSMNPFFVARGPAFKRGYTLSQVIENIHLYPLMCDIMKIPPSQYMDGRLEEMKHILKVKPSLLVRLVRISPALLATLIICILIFVTVLSFGVYSCISHRRARNSSYMQKISMKELQKSEEPLLRDNDESHFASDVDLDETVS